MFDSSGEILKPFWSQKSKNFCSKEALVDGIHNNLNSFDLRLLGYPVCRVFCA